MLNLAKNLLNEKQNTRKSSGKSSFLMKTLLLIEKEKSYGKNQKIILSKSFH